MSEVDKPSEARALFDSLKGKAGSEQRFMDVQSQLPSTAEAHEAYLAATNAGGVYVHRDPLDGLGTCDHVDDKGWPLLKPAANDAPASY